MGNLSNSVALVVVLSTRNLNQYIIPSFPALKVTLREVKLQWYEEETDTLHVFDGFAHHCDRMDCSLPAMAEIHYGNDIAFLIEV